MFRRTSFRHASLGFTFATLLLLAACGEDPAATQPPAEDDAEEAVEQPAEEDAVADDRNGEDADEDPPPSATVPSDLQDRVELAIEDTVAQTGASEADIEVELAERVTWRDGSMGCPEPGGMYTQALVEGYRIILSVDGDERAYHGRDGDEPFYCSDPQEPLGGSNSGGTVDR